MLLAAVTPSSSSSSLLLLPPFLPVYRLVKRRNKQKRAQRREDIPPSPPPHYLPIFIQPFLSWRGIIPLQASEILGLGRDGVTTDRPKQGKPRRSEHGQLRGLVGASVCFSGSVNNMGTVLPAPLHSSRLHGAAAWPQSQVQPAVLSLGGREGLGAVSKIQGMRWKVNSDTGDRGEGINEGGWVSGSCY